MDFLKKRLKRLTSMGLALLLSASAFPATAFAASDSTSTLAEVTAKYIDAENGKEIAEQEIYSVTHEERQPQEIENYTYGSDLYCRLPGRKRAAGCFHDPCRSNYGLLPSL